MSRAERRLPNRNGGVSAEGGHPRTSCPLERADRRRTSRPTTNASRIDDVDERQRAAPRPIVPSDSARVSATPWNSGVSQASGLEDGRQRLDREERAREQEQRRDPEAEDRRERVRRLAASRRTRRSAPRTPARSGPPTGIASTISGDAAAPNRTMTSVKTDRDRASAGRRSRRGCRARCRAAVIGVANIAWKIRFHSSPPMIGNVASNAAVCIAVAASRPGARNARYGTPPSAARVDVDVGAEPRPIAARNSDGRQERAEDRSRGTSAGTAGRRCSKTRPIPADGRPGARRAASTVG